MIEGTLYVRRWSLEAAARIFFALAECGGEPLGFFRVQRNLVNSKVRSLAVRVRLPEAKVADFEAYAKVKVERLCPGGCGLPAGHINHALERDRVMSARGPA